MSSEPPAVGAARASGELVEGDTHASELLTSPAYREFVENAPDAVVVIGGDGCIRLVNTAAESMFGYRRNVLLGQQYTVLLPGGLTTRRRYVRDGVPPDAGIEDGAGLKVNGRRMDGTEVPVEVDCRPMSFGPGLEITASAENVVSSRQSERELRDALSLLNATLESTADGILVLTTDGQIASFNEQFISMSGIPRTLMGSMDESRMIAFILDQLADPDTFVNRMDEICTDPDTESNDVFELHDGRTFERYSRPQRVADQIVGRVWSFRDVTSRRQAQDQADRALADLAQQAEQLRVLAFSDPLTGLANRVLFLDRLEGALAKDPGGVHILLLDIDSFKDVNDVQGHQAGDELLIATGKRLTECVRPADTVARLGGDEFVIVLQGGEDAELVAHRIVVALQAPVLIAGREMRLSVSLGLTSAVDGQTDVPELLRQADIAMYAAKAAGKNRFERFQPTMLTTLLERTDLESGLRHAVERGEIVVHFQPIVSAADGAVLQVEALARWQWNDRLVAPLDFIPAAEKSGHIIGIGLEVMAQSCRQLRAWLDESEHHSVAVNVSCAQLCEPDFAVQALDVMSLYGVRPEQVTVEVTESVFSAPGGQVTEQLSWLRGKGVRISIDDFGTGYSSLGRLQELPLDSLKIDKSFVAMIRTGQEDLPILTSMLTMARSLGLLVTAEGVETEAQARTLLSMGCDSLQGYLFSMPRRAENLLDAEEDAVRTMNDLWHRARR